MQSYPKASVLVVDDRAEKLLAAEAMLAELPLEVVTANSGRAALRCLLRRDFAVILLDVDMPIIDGFETAALIRQRQRSEHVPIIFMTAHSDEMFVERGYSLGAVDYILQPVVPEILRAKVSVFVELHHKSCQLLAQAHEQKSRAQQLQKLASSSVAINAARSVAAALEIITDSARDVIGSHQAITLFRAEVAGASPQKAQASQGSAGHPQAFSAYSDKYRQWRGRELRLDVAAHSVIATSGKPTRLGATQLSAHPDYPLIATLESKEEIPPVRGLLACPLIGPDGRNMGVIYLSDKVEGEFTADDEAILLQLSQMAVVAIENHLNSDARQANRAKDQFLAVLSHELRTPLMPALVTLSEMIGDKRLPQELQSELEMVRRNVELEARLIDDLLDLTRVSKGKIELRMATVDAHALLGETLKICNVDISGKGLKVTCELAAAHCHVRADRARLQQILWNLLKNAVKFTPAGGSIAISTENNSSRSLIVRVTDTGIGIEPELLPKIFNAFEQGDRSIRGQFGGLGLGLAITKALVDGHGGAVRASSQGRGTGATFILELPVDAQYAAARILPLPRLVETAASRGLRILLVEDHVDTSHVLKRLLSKQSHEVHTARTLAEALAATENCTFDLVISDIGLPDGSGLDLMPQLRQRGSVVGIALSGFGMEEDVLRSREAGFREHLTKPLNFQTLIDCIDRIAAEIDDARDRAQRAG